MNLTNGLIYARQSRQRTIGFELKFAVGTSSPEGNEPKGFNSIARGIPKSFYMALVLGIRSVVTRSNDLSAFNSSKSCPSN